MATTKVQEPISHNQPNEIPSIVASSPQQSNPNVDCQCSHSHDCSTPSEYTNDNQTSDESIILSPSHDWQSQSQLLLGCGPLGPLHSTHFRNHRVTIKTLHHIPKHFDPHQLKPIISRLRHPNLTSVVAIIGPGERNIWHVAERYIDGSDVSLELILSQSGHILSPAARIRVLFDVASALGHLHQTPLPIVHRHITPGNVLLQPCAKSSDSNRFFHARVSHAVVGSLLNMASAQSELQRSDNPPSHSTLKDHRIIGSVGYICPDYAITGLVNPSVDLYGFGALIMQMVIGRPQPPPGVKVDFTKVEKNTRILDGISSHADTTGGEWKKQDLHRLLELSLRLLIPVSRNRPSIDHTLNQIREMVSPDEHGHEISDTAYSSAKYGSYSVENGDKSDSLVCHGSTHMDESPPMNSARSSVFQERIEAASLYLEKVKATFSNEPEIYFEFLQTMRDYKNGVIHSSRVMERITSLFTTESILVEEFKRFLLEESDSFIEYDGDVCVQSSSDNQQQKQKRHHHRQQEQEQEQQPNSQSPPESAPMDDISNNHSGGRGQEQSGHQNDLHTRRSLSSQENDHTKPSKLTDSSREGSDGSKNSFGQALAFVRVVKERFQESPETYITFFRNLQGYKTGILSFADLNTKVLDLFKEHPDLLEQFSLFASSISPES